MTAPRFLIDENLSPELASVARRRGYHAMHVRDVGLLGAKDWRLLQLVLDGDWTLATNNTDEFRSRYLSSASLHAGIVFLVGIDSGRTAQAAAFEAALSLLDADPDIVNQEIVVRRRGLGWTRRRGKLPRP
jgi:predicted nuclease of predicted toxin-antitoxin system